jgi:GntR family transcriptional regulator, carbon starvation induced regulator
MVGGSFPITLHEYQCSRTVSKYMNEISQLNVASKVSLVAAPQTLTVLEDLRSRIQECVLMPGERLKFEELAAYYGASVASLREALIALEVEGSVVSAKNRGFQVAPVSVTDLLDITELRVDLERRAMRLSIEHGDEAWEAKLLSTWHLLSKTQAARANAEIMDPIWTQRHRDFHAVLLEGCPSEKNRRFCSQLFNLAQRYQRLSVKYRAGSRSRGFEEHGDLVKLALARDAENACHVVENHIRATTQSILAAVPQFKAALA